MVLSANMRVVFPRVQHPTAGWQDHRSSVSRITAIFIEEFVTWSMI
jgi:hypothetical protein